MLTENDIQSCLDSLSLFFRETKSLVSVSYLYQPADRIVVRFQRNKLPGEKLPKTHTIYSTRERRVRRIPIVYEEGPDISPSLGHVKRHRPKSSPDRYRAAGIVLGGSFCQNTRNMNFYGTIAFTAGSVQWSITGGACAGGSCAAAPAIVSCNHVIALSDVGQPGDVIYTQEQPAFGTLTCAIPFRCGTWVDLALGTVGNVANTLKWSVKTIGGLAGIRRPNIGEFIHKHGARTNYTKGNVTGKTNINSTGGVFRGVFSTTPGFSCHGDSGSAVVAGNGDVVGIISWGDEMPCEQNPTGYFYTLDRPGEILNDFSRDGLALVF